jgi:hypothetical protein
VEPFGHGLVQQDVESCNDNADLRERVRLNKIKARKRKKKGKEKGK